MKEAASLATSLPADVLTKALTRAAQRLGLSQKVLARTLGVSEATVSRLGSGRRISPDSKEGELALLLLRLFRSLDSLFGGNEAQSRAWMQAANHHLGEPPIALIERVVGLMQVIEYLDSMRGKS
jgi:uncharacterized protein (DUF2384 family)